MSSTTREQDLTDFHACIRQGDAASAREVADRLYGQGGAFSPLFVDDIVSSSEASALILELAPYWPTLDIVKHNQLVSHSAVCEFGSIPNSRPGV